MKIKLLGATLALALSQPVLAENQQLSSTCLIDTVSNSFEWNDKKWIDTGGSHGGSSTECGIGKCLTLEDNLISHCTSTKLGQISDFIQPSDENWCQFFAYAPLDRVFSDNDGDKSNIEEYMYKNEQALDALQDDDDVVRDREDQNLYFNYSYDNYNDIGIVSMATQRGSEDYGCEDNLFSALNTYTYNESDYEFDNLYQAFRAMGIDEIAIIDSAVNIGLDTCDNSNQLCWVDDGTEEKLSSSDEINPVVNIADISNEAVWVKVKVKDDEDDDSGD